MEPGSTRCGTQCGTWCGTRYGTQCGTRYGTRSSCGTRSWCGETSSELKIINGHKLDRNILEQARVEYSYTQLAETSVFGISKKRPTIFNTHIDIFCYCSKRTIKAFLQTQFGNWSNGLIPMLVKLRQSSIEKLITFISSVRLQITYYVLGTWEGQVLQFTLQLKKIKML